MKRIQARNIDEYIASYPQNVQRLLKTLRTTIRKSIPGVEETIKYAIPTFMVNGKNIVFFAAYDKHIGFYPVPREAGEFKQELSGYEGGKGTMQLPLDKPLPLSLITKIVKYRLKRYQLMPTTKASRQKNTKPKSKKAPAGRTARAKAKA